MLNVWNSQSVHRRIGAQSTWGKTFLPENRPICMKNSRDARKKIGDLIHLIFTRKIKKNPNFTGYLPKNIFPNVFGGLNAIPLPTAYRFISIADGQ